MGYEVTNNQTNSKYPDSLIVDENDNPIGRMQMPEAIRQGKILRIARVLVIANDEFLMQKRGPGVIAPGLWNETASGHVDFSDSYESAAQRELEEEAGVTNVKLQEIDKTYVEEEVRYGLRKAFEMIFIAKTDKITPIIADPDEVAELKWLSLTDIEGLVNTKPRQVTNGFMRVWQSYLDKIVSSKQGDTL